MALSWGNDSQSWALTDVAPDEPCARASDEEGGWRRAAVSSVLEVSRRAHGVEEGGVEDRHAP